jgi:nicotinamide-nucleotide amidase
VSSQVSILCTGSELLDGRILDTNTHLIIHRMHRLGLLVKRSISCRDVESDILENLGTLCSNSKVLIVSGGLGPTSDDITRDVIARFVGVQLKEDAQSVQNLKELYAKRKRTFEASNARQALFPEGATILPNPIGTAPGFALVHRGVLICSVPGVPKELEPMLETSVLPMVAAHLGVSTGVESRVFRIFGLSEAKIGELVEQDGVPQGVNVSYRASFPEIFVRLTSAQRDGRVAQFAYQRVQRIGPEFIVNETEAGGFETHVQQLLIEKKLTLCAAESCTGGLVSRLMTETPGSSACFLGAAVTYSNASKINLLGVDSDIIAKHGAVSAECAQAMAHGARKRFAADLAISITGIAGPDGGTETKPVGTFFIGLDDGVQTISFHCFLHLNRAWFRSYAAVTALDVVRRHILNLPPIHARVRVGGLA